MNTLKGWISTTFLLTVVSLTSIPVNAGIIVGNLSGQSEKPPCYNSSANVDWGIIVGNFTGIIVGNLTGIIVGNATEAPVQNCSIIVGN